jgi:hypothetical protein
MPKRVRKVFATLSPIYCELPYESKELKNKDKKLKKELNKLGIAFYRRTGSDYGYKPYPQTPTNTFSLTPVKSDPQEIKPGTLVKIFKSVSDADVIWSGKIELDYINKQQRSQTNLCPKIWSRMFFDNLPTKLIRNGKTIFGSLEPYSEPDMKEFIWAIQAYGSPGYNGLTFLENGDELEIYTNVRNGEVDWEGNIEYSKKSIYWLGNSEVIRVAKHTDPVKWLNMVNERRPAVIIKKDI